MSAGFCRRTIRRCVKKGTQGHADCYDSSPLYRAQRNANGAPRILVYTDVDDATGNLIEPYVRVCPEQNYLDHCRLHGIDRTCTASTVEGWTEVFTPETTGLNEEEEETYEGYDEDNYRA